MLFSSKADKFALTLVALCFLPTPALTGASLTEDCAARALQLLRSVFPGLDDAQIQIQYHNYLNVRRPLHNRYSVTFHLYRTYEPDGVLPARSENLIDAIFRFSPKNDSERGLKKGQLMELMVLGPFDWDRANRLRKEVDAHPEWTDAQIVGALKAAGAKFGPDDREAFLRALPKAFEPLTGRLEVVSATFGVRFDRVAEDEPPGADLSWHVDTKWYSRDGRYAAHYRLWFEPFEGALLSLLAIRR